MITVAITACPREIVPRGGHPLGLIEYIIERVYQVFLSFELHKFGIFWNLHQPKGVPTPYFSSTDRILGGCPSLTFLNYYKFKWFKWKKNLVHSFYYILYQPKGVPTPRENFSGTGVSLGSSGYGVSRYIEISYHRDWSPKFMTA